MATDKKLKEEKMELKNVQKSSDMKRTGYRAVESKQIKYIKLIIHKFMTGAFQQKLYVNGRSF